MYAVNYKIRDIELNGFDLLRKIIYEEPNTDRAEIKTIEKTSVY